MHNNAIVNGIFINNLQKFNIENSYQIGTSVEKELVAEYEKASPFLKSIVKKIEKKILEEATRLFQYDKNRNA